MLRSFQSSRMARSYAGKSSSLGTGRKTEELAIWVAAIAQSGRPHDRFGGISDLDAPSRFVQPHEGVAGAPERFDGHAERLELAVHRDANIELVGGERAEAVARVEQIDAVELQIDERLTDHVTGEPPRPPRPTHREGSP